MCWHNYNMCRHKWQKRHNVKGAHKPHKKWAVDKRSISISQVSPLFTRKNEPAQLQKMSAEMAQTAQTAQYEMCQHKQHKRAQLVLSKDDWFQSIILPSFVPVSGFFLKILSPQGFNLLNYRILFLPLWFKNVLSFPSRRNIDVECCLCKLRGSGPFREHWNMYIYLLCLP